MADLVPDDDATTLDELTQHVHHARFRAQRAANTELLRLYWRIGRTILERQVQQAWGSKVLERLAADLRAEFPTMKGFSRRNLLYMRAFAEAWPSEDELVQRGVAHLPWGHVIELLSKLDDPELRDWYAVKDAQHGWTRSVLAHQIATNLHDRESAAPSNFPAALDGRDSDLAQQLTKDPYTLEILALDGSEASTAPESARSQRRITNSSGSSSVRASISGSRSTFPSTVGRSR